MPQPGRKYVVNDGSSCYTYRTCDIAWKSMACSHLLCPALLSGTVAGSTKAPSTLGGRRAHKMQERRDRKARKGRVRQGGGATKLTGCIAAVAAWWYLLLTIINWKF
jgi:hypothetical protein